MQLAVISKKLGYAVSHFQTGDTNAIDDQTDQPPSWPIDRSSNRNRTRIGRHSLLQQGKEKYIFEKRTS